jgi:thiopurine S-methyltransferase
MDAEFWHQRWREQRIGFHLEKVNPQLLAHWPALGLSAPARVLVPLCGKSVDLRWLRDYGHDVVGIELSPLAVEQFFAEQGLSARRELIGEVVRWSAPGITVLCGDFFAVDAELLGRVDAVYDRAALIALPAVLRPRYMRHLAGLVRPGATGLLITMDYDQATMDGPPFAVQAREVEQLAEGDWQLYPVAARDDALDDNPRFSSAGLAAIREAVWQLERLPAPAQAGRR